MDIKLQLIITIIHFYKGVYSAERREGRYTLGFDCEAITNTFDTFEFILISYHWQVLLRFSKQQHLFTYFFGYIIKSIF